MIRFGLLILTQREMEERRDSLRGESILENIDQTTPLLKGMFVNPVNESMLADPSFISEQWEFCPGNTADPGQNHLLTLYLI